MAETKHALVALARFLALLVLWMAMAAALGPLIVLSFVLSGATMSVDRILNWGADLSEAAMDRLGVARD